MGGHPGAFTDVYLKEGDKCFVACGKKIKKDTRYPDNTMINST